MFIDEDSMREARKKQNTKAPAEVPVLGALAANQPPLIRRQRSLLADLAHLVTCRAQDEPREESGFKSGSATAHEKFELARQSLNTQVTAKRVATDTEYEEARQRITQQYESGNDALEKEFVTEREKILDLYDTDKEGAKAEYQEGSWTINAIFDGTKTALERQFNESKGDIAVATQRMEAIRHETADFLQKCRQRCVLPRPKVSAKLVRGMEDPVAELKKQVSAADTALTELKDLKIPRYFQGERLLWFFLVLWIAFIPLSWLIARLVLDYEGPAGWAYALLGSVAGVLVLGGAPILWLYVVVAKRHVNSILKPMGQDLAEAEALVSQCQERAAMGYHGQLGEAKRKCDKDLREATEKYQRHKAEIKERREREIQETMEKHRRLRVELKERRDNDLKQADEKHRRVRAEIDEQFETVSRQVVENYTRQIDEAKQAYERGWQCLLNQWHEGLAQVYATVIELDQASGKLFPDWSDPRWDRWTPALDIPPAIRIGSYQVSLEQMPNGLPRDPRLQPKVPTSYTLPALLSFPAQCSILLKGEGDGRTHAVQVLQTVMFRLLTTIAPGKIRFTIIDPVGLGQNFASFMHLADYDEALVTSRIWTEVPHIEQRLADITGHMENVIQKYLRNQFESIEEYNAHAGEVAEPYRILVVANFPANFSSEATRRLVSIVNSGPRCGVYTLITVDTKQALPKEFNLADLERRHVNFVWNDPCFSWRDADFEKHPLQLDAPPPADFCTRILKRVGESAKEAKRVEVPFEFVAPPPEQWWTADSRTGISVPLGRVGATKRQHLKLGQGTSQHVLIAGKTGSGKSTLLHALISNLSLLYSPQEVELYLIDFKKGVEFKTYASHELPHARVVAIESEREFGLSVLQRLDAELRGRGERFRLAGAQDLNSYRQANGNAPLPRILLIVDEFQEFFVEDDKVAQEAALLLDRLVRQGRAFGLHVLLGSQTLGGAYTLARSTIDQMAVRIALQCSEADGHIILSDDNSAARLLSRPGEAIYNDANGLVEGNNPFQIVWLAEEQREEYLRQIQELSRKQPFVAPHAQIVFEGNAPADIGKNHLLEELLIESTWPANQRMSHAWLGESIAIKDPTAATFRAQSGGNLLIVGQNEEAALGILSIGFIGLAAQHPVGARFYLLDGSPEDSPLAGVLPQMASGLPHQIHLGGRRELAAAIKELAEEVERRHQASDHELPPIFLFIYGLQRFRELRRSEDDFSFSRSTDEPPNPAKQFGNILREGPTVRIHTLLWCDSLNNVNRALERQALCEFELRVLFQMSATDSANLIDTPLASKLGLHRALFHSEEQGRLEKFRPYAIPPENWLERVKQQLARKCAVPVP